MSHFNWSAVIGGIIFFLGLSLIIYFRTKRNVSKTWNIVVGVFSVIGGMIAIGSLFPKSPSPEVEEEKQVVNETRHTDTVESTLQTTQNTEYENYKRFTIEDISTTENLVIINLRNDHKYAKFDVDITVPEGSCLRLYNTSDFPKGQVSPYAYFCVKVIVDRDEYASVVNKRNRTAWHPEASFIIDFRNDNGTFADVKKLDLFEIFGVQ